MSSTPPPAMDPTPDENGFDLTEDRLIRLLRRSQQPGYDKYMVIVAYELPKGGGIFLPAGGDEAAPLAAPGTDGLNGMPPGKKSSVFQFPYPQEQHLARLTPRQLVELLNRRTKLDAAVQGIATVSATAYANAVQQAVHETLDSIPDEVDENNG